MADQKKVIMYHSNEAAKEVVVKGWLAADGSFWPSNKPKAEHMARYCGATHKTCECGEIYLMRGYCRPCRDKKSNERYLALPEKKWDGELPICIWDSEEYFFHEEELADFMEEHGIKSTDEIQLVDCKEIHLRYVDDDYWHDELAEGSELPADVTSALEVLNKAIRAAPAVSYYIGSNRLTGVEV